MFADEADRTEGLWADLVDPGLVESAEVDGLVLDAEGVDETLELRKPLLQRNLATLIPKWDLATSLCALCAAACCLAALARGAASNAFGHAGSHQRPISDRVASAW